MTNKYKSVIYNKILLLSMDIENVFGDTWVVEKMYVYFNKNFIEGKCIKPYAIKFIINHLGSDDNRTILQTEEYKWCLEDIYNKLNMIPLYLIKKYPRTNYGFVDINDNVYPISDIQKVSHLQQYEDASYEFEVRNGSIVINELVISEIENILKKHDISYEIITATKVSNTPINKNQFRSGVETKHSDETKENEQTKDKNEDSEQNDENDENDETEHSDANNHEIKKYISVYGIYQECEPSYKINISLDGKSYDDTGYCITPEPIEFKPYVSIGKFKMFDKRNIRLPNDEHLALITKCLDCGASIICDWLNLKGTRCPYCNEVTKL